MLSRTTSRVKPHPLMGHRAALMRSSKSRTPIDPISAIGWAIVVSAGKIAADCGMSSNPITETSSGTRHPAAAAPDGADRHLIVEGEDRGDIASANDPPLRS